MDLSPEIIKVDRLEVTYPGGIKAVDGISFSVREGEIFGLLGPNGAGKTTTIMVLTTLLKPTRGTALINGLDVTRHKNRVRFNLGYVSQDLAVDDELSGWDNLRLQAGLYHMDSSVRKQRLEEVLELVGLQCRARDRVATYSGGMRKRLDIACGLIHRPRVLFLDEPTLGLDIQTRHEIWKYITRLREEVNMTILMTTHYMDEADHLCDRIAIVDRGCLVAVDQPGLLKSGLGGDLITFSFTSDTAPEAVDQALKHLEEQPFVEKFSPQEQDGEYILVTGEGAETLPRLFASLAGLPARLARVSLKSPSLDDVFLFYTGRQLREENASLEDVHRQRLKMRRIRGRQ